MSAAFPSFLFRFVLLSFFGLGVSLFAQQTVFYDNFNASQGTNYTTTGKIGTSPWTVTRSGNDFGAKIDGGLMTLTNDVGSAANANGWVSSTVSTTTSFDSRYNPILSQNAGIVSWTFNMRQSANISGFGNGQYGVAFILAGTPGSNNSTGKGYAIQLGGSSKTVRFVRYENGLSNYYTYLSTKDLGSFANDYISIRVDYNPADNQWTLYARKDGNSFLDPKNGTTFQESLPYSNYVNEPLTLLGAYWNAGSARNQTAVFDNVSVSVTLPEITTIAPVSKTMNSGAFTLTVNGKNFNTASRVYWNGALRPTTYISPTQLSAAIPASDIPAPATVPITVRNAAYISNAVNFTVVSSGTPILNLTKSTLPQLTTVQGTASADSESYVLSGSNLTGNVSITAPPNFEISLDNNTFSDSQSVAPVSGSVNNRTLKARIKATAPVGIHAGNITHAATAATPKTVAVSGRVLAPEPTTPASNITFSNITSTGFALNWTIGNGAQRLVLVKALNAVDSQPEDGAIYLASAAFGSGSQLGTGNFVVYKGTGNTVQVTGLQPATAYYVSIIEFNGAETVENYRTPGTVGNTLTLSSPEGLQIKVAGTSYKIDFDHTVEGVNQDAFRGSGMAKVAESGQLDSDAWAFTGFSGGDIAFGGASTEGSSYENGVSDGGETDTGIYAFNVGTAPEENYTLGIQPGGADFNSGTITLKIQNKTGAPLTGLNIGYKVFVYNDQASSTKIEFGTSASESGSFTPITPLEVTSPAAADLAPGWKAYHRVVTLTGLNIASNDYYYLRWSGSLVSGSGAQDEFAIDDIEIIGNPSTNSVSFDGVAEDFVLQGNATLSADLTVQNRLVFNGGKLKIADKTLTSAGSIVNTTAGGLSGGPSAKLIIRGTQNPALSFDQTTLGTTNLFQNFSVAGYNASTVTVDNPFVVNSLLQVDELKVLDLKTHAVTGAITAVQNDGTILTQNTTAVPFRANLTWNGKGYLHMNATSAAQSLPAGTYGNLRLSSTGGTTALANITVNGILDLPSPNASATKSSLDMGTFTLTMGEDGKNTGVGEVTGIIRRNSFTTNKLYTFGHPNSSITFPPGGTLPTSMSAKLTIGAAPSWRPGAIKRYFDIIQTGAASTKAIIRQHYLDSELNGHNESKLVFYAHKVAGSETFEQGKSNSNATENFVEISNANVAQYFVNTFGNVFITLDETANTAVVVWNGSESDSWTTVNNWTPNVKPGPDTKVIIPDTATTIHDPTLNPSEQIGSLVIEAGGILKGADGTILALNSGAGAWQNFGAFNAGTSTVIFNNIDATLAGSTDFYNVTVPAGGGLRALEGNNMGISGSLVNNGTMFTTLTPNTIEFKGSNQTIPAPGGEAFGGYHHLIVSGPGTSIAPSSLNVRGNLTLNQPVDFSGKTVNLAGVADQILSGTAASVIFNNLILDKPTGRVILNRPVTVQGVLSLTKGNMVLGANDLTLGTAAVAGAPFGIDNMIVADAAGKVRRPFTATGSYLFPIGESTGALSYSPINVNVTSGTFSSGMVSVNLMHQKHPNNSSSQNYLRKYWNVEQTGITGAVATITATYQAGDVVGSETDIAAAQLKGNFNLVSNPWLKFGPLAANTLTAENAELPQGVNVFTGLKAAPFTVEVYGYGEFCQGSPATLEAVTEGGDAPFTYEWSNGLPDSATVTVPTASTGTVTYTLTVRDANGIIAMDNNSPVTVLPPTVGGSITNSTQQICAGTRPADLQLTGHIGTVLYWQRSPDINFVTEVVNISNFTDVLPTSQMNPVYGTTYFRAVVKNGSCAEAFSQPATVSINATVWNGASWSLGLPTITTTAVFESNYDTSQEAIDACSCDVRTGVTLTVSSGTTVTIQNDIINNGKIVVENDGNLIQVSDSGRYIRDAVSDPPVAFTAKRTANIKRLDYVYWSSPVRGQQLKAFSPGTLNSRFYTYNEWDDKFTVVPDVTVPFEPGMGYAIRARNTQPNVAENWTGQFSGIPNNGEITVPLLIKSGTDGSGNGYNLVGNPYPSNINFKTLVDEESNPANSAAIHKVAYFWTNTNPNGPMQGSNYPQDGLINNYAVYNATGGVPATAPATNATPENPEPTISSPTPDGFIKVGQGFIVKAKEPAQTLTFRNNVRVDSPGHFFDKSQKKDRFWLHLTTPLKVMTTTLIGYTASATDGFELDYDAPLMVLGSDAFYSLLEDRRLAIQGRSSFVNSDQVLLGSSHHNAGSYTISLGKKEGIFENGQKIYLKDKQTDTIISLSDENYTFTAQKGLLEGRFEIIYKKESVLSDDDQLKDALVVYRDGEQFVVKSKNKDITGVQVYDTSGRLVSSTDERGRTVTLPAESWANGIYILKIDQMGKITSKKVVR